MRAPTRASLAVAAVAVLAIDVASARAERPVGYPIAVTAAVRRGDLPVTAAVLIGAAGQLYRPTDAGVWRRDAVGGVSVDVAGAISGTDVLFAGGRATPLFRYAAGSWHVDPLQNRGPTSFATSGAPALAIGRHVYLLTRDHFTRVASAKPTIAAVWAASKQRIYVAGQEGQLLRFDGKGWIDIAQPLPAADRITRLVGVSGKQLVALSASGAVLEVGARTARRIPADSALVDFRAVLACPDLTTAGDGAIFVVGTMAGDSEPRWVLARAHRGRLVEVEPLTAPGGDDFTVLLADPAGGLLLATRHGQVRIRGGDGQWTSGNVSGAPPEVAPPADHGRPGRSR